MSDRGTLLSGAIAFFLLLVLTVSLAPQGIEEDIAERATTELELAGHDFALVEVSGRDVRLSGAAPDDVAAAEALALVRELWGVHSAQEDFATAALRAPVEDVLEQPGPLESTPPQYTDRERSALDRRITREVCQQLVDGLLASDSIHFDAESATIQARSAPLLEHVATAAVHCPDSRLLVGGHTDDSGDGTADLRLSEQRALAVAEFLASRGVSPPRLGTVGYGASRPLANNASESGRAMNRRIEITVVH